MTLFILLMLFVFWANSQHRKDNFPPKKDPQEKQDEYKKQHENNMELYDYLHRKRVKRHEDWLSEMKKLYPKDYADGN